jgi:hypothetical protein
MAFWTNFMHLPRPHKTADGVGQDGEGDQRRACAAASISAESPGAGVQGKRSGSSS